MNILVPLYVFRKYTQNLRPLVLSQGDALRRLGAGADEGCGDQEQRDSLHGFLLSRDDVYWRAPSLCGTSRALPDKMENSHIPARGE